MKAKLIKTEADYEQALAHLESLMEALPGTPEEEELELFAVLIENYEQEHFPIGMPDPVEAIKFRMEQQGLKRSDLIPYIGSQSKVSEVLNKKRSLSLAMIRALHTGLGIPAEVLLQESGARLAEPQFKLQDYPFKEMYQRGYFKGFNGPLAEAKAHAEELLNALFQPLQRNAPQPVYCRNSEGEMDRLALMAWQARALALADEQELPPYNPADMTRERLVEVIHLSKFNSGPALAAELLQKYGIALVILPHLPHTYLDGACFLSPTGRPVIGLTLRHDRLDNFWFTLAHELAHVFLHLKDANLAFFDETEHGAQRSSHPQETEANTLAAEILVPSEIWQHEKAGLISKARINALANRLGIAPAIIAGRLRWENSDYAIFAQLLGHQSVRKQFTAESANVI